MRRVSVALAGLLACAMSTHAEARNQRPVAAKPTAPKEAVQEAGQEVAMHEAGAERVWVSESGTASWYGNRHHGRRTASGVLFNQHAMTAAHPWLPLGSKVRVTRLDTGQSIVVTITDRLPTKKHIIDLSLGAAEKLNMVRAGIARVDLDPA